MAGKHSGSTDTNSKHRERLRQRLEKHGLAGFHDYEVAELLLTFTRPQGDVKPIAKAAIARFGSVRGILDAPRKELETITGIGARSAATIKVLKALVECYYNDRMHEVPSALGNSREVVDYLRIKMGSLERETFVVLYLDAQNRPVKEETLFEGTLTSSVVYPREVFRKALDHGAASMIFAHNHPSGCVDPSADDRRITCDLVFAANYMDINVLDHIVVGADSHFSFADHGLIREYRKRAMDFHENHRAA